MIAYIKGNDILAVAESDILNFPSDVKRVNIDKDISPDEIRFYDYIDGKFVFNKEKKQKFEEEKREEIKNSLIYRLIDICDRKTKEAINTIVGVEITPEQERRYKEKYKAALEYKKTGVATDGLTLEAKLRDITVDELVDFIIKKGDEYFKLINEISLKVDVFRVAINNLIKNDEIEKASRILDKAEELSPFAKIEEIEALFKD